MSVRVRCIVAGLVLAAAGFKLDGQTKTRNVVLVVSDGLRWQEVFRGADPSLLDSKRGGVRDADKLRSEFYRPEPEAARQALLPFFWSVVARQGQLFGNRDRRSIARVANGLNFSYPGYNEMLTGRPDPRIDRNDFGPNPNETVFEILGREEGFRGRVAAFATWGVFNDIFARERSRIPVYAGWDPPLESSSPRLLLLRELYRTTTRIWEDNSLDSLMHAALKEYLREHRPRLLFAGYGETDEWAHAGRYDLTLRAAHQFDRFLADLWETLQGLPEYRDQTLLLVTTDHGRGSGPSEWRQHGRKIRGSEAVWIAALGPDVAARGERDDVGEVTLGQIAPTIAKFCQPGMAPFSQAPPLPF